MLRTMLLGDQILITRDSTRSDIRSVPNIPSRLEGKGVVMRLELVSPEKKMRCYPAVAQEALSLVLRFAVSRQVQFKPATPL